MGFKRLINSKKILSLLAVFTLLGTSLVKAQDAAAAASGDAPLPPVDWMGIGYYVLLFLILCFVVAIVGKILKVYDLTQQIQSKKPLNWNNVMGTVCVCSLFLVVMAHIGQLPSKAAWVYPKRLQYMALR